MNATAVSTSSLQENSIRTPSFSERKRLRNLIALEPVQIPHRIQLEISALAESNKKFNDCLRDYQYIKWFKKYGYGNIPWNELKPCTILDHPSQKWGFLPCDHFFCANCCPETDNYEFICSVENCGKKFSKQVVHFIDMQRSVTSSTLFKIVVPEDLNFKKNWFHLFYLVVVNTSRIYLLGKLLVSKSGEIH